MSNEPKFVGVTPGEDPTVTKYKAGLAERAKAAGDARRVPVPNFVQAQTQFDPKREGGMTLAQIGEAQRTMSAVAGEGQPMLQEETARGLLALSAEVQKQKAERGASVSNDLKKVSEGETKETTPEEKVKLREALDEADDLELEYLLARSRQDLINNDEQRKIIDERVGDLDLADGITTGEFKQLVPIKPGVLEVLYRTVSPMEIEHIRRLVLEMQLRDERLSNLSVDRFTLMQTVASIVHINGQALPTHVERPGTLEAKFLDETFLKKYSIIGGYPGPMIHSLSTHAYWFDLRVRKLFSMEALKNG